MDRLNTYRTRNDLPSEVREQLIAILNQQLADTFDLYSQTKQAHWNVKGPEFFQLHELFDRLADEAEGYVDLIAERAAACPLGHSARTTGAGHRWAKSSARKTSPSTRDGFVSRRRQRSI